MLCLPLSHALLLSAFVEAAPKLPLSHAACGPPFWRIPGASLSSPFCLALTFRRTFLALFKSWGACSGNRMTNTRISSAIRGIYLSRMRLSLSAASPSRQRETCLCRYCLQVARSALFSTSPVCFAYSPVFSSCLTSEWIHWSRLGLASNWRYKPFARLEEDFLRCPPFH